MTLDQNKKKIKEKFQTNIINNVIPRLVRHQLIIFEIAKKLEKYLLANAKNLKENLKFHYLV